MDYEAKALNDTIIKYSGSVYSLLSRLGREMYFPKGGILSQAEDAKKSKINATLGVALFDDKTPMRLECLADKIALDSKRALLYTKAYGSPEMTQRWNEMMLIKNPGITGSISMPVGTLGLTGGLYDGGYLFVDENDTFVFSDPYWETYSIYEKTFGAKLIKFRMFNEKGGLNIEGLHEAIKDLPTPKILLNFPHNPTGYSPTFEEADKLAEMLNHESSKRPLLVILDDAYSGLVYKEGVMRESLFSKLHNISRSLLCVKLDGISKEDYAWGLRVGFITYGIKDGTPELYKALQDKTAGVIRATISNVPHLSQSLMFDASNMEDYWDQKARNHNILKKRYDKIHQVLSHEKFREHFDMLPCNSGYFLCLRVKDGINVERVRCTLNDKYSTGVISFEDNRDGGVEGYIRIAFSSLPEEQIEQMFDNINSACRDVQESVY